MSIAQLKEKLLPVANPEPYWFWRAIDEKKVSWRDLIGGALQHIMECKVLQQLEKVFPSSHLDPYGFKKDIDERYLLGYLQIIVFQHPMK